MKDACEKWLKALGDRKFMGDEKPKLADLALYGAINSFVGCRAFQEMRSQTKIGEWFVLIIYFPQYLLFLGTIVFTKKLFISKVDL